MPFFAGEGFLSTAFRLLFGNGGTIEDGVRGMKEMETPSDAFSVRCGVIDAPAADLEHARTLKEIGLEGTLP